MPAPLAFMRDPMTSGVHGDVTIAANTTLAPGTSKYYKNLTVNALKSLAATGGGWIKIGVAVNLVVNGTIGGAIDTTQGTTYSDQAADGLNLEYSVSNQNGGDGGAGGVIANPGGLGLFGNGGGGGAINGGQDGIANFGGPGGDGTDVAGGIGGSVPGGFGETPADAVTTDDDDYYGPGGGGGARGAHGGGIYIKVWGNTTGTGRITSTGQNGGDGGAGASVFSSCPSGMTTPFISTGGGGGGGVGGSGGGIAIKHHGSFSGSILIDADQGQGGNAGQAGSGTCDNGDVFFGVAGNDGPSGDLGNFTNMAY